MKSNDPYLDRQVWGAEAIAEEAGLFTEDGQPDARKAFYLLEKKLLPARKIGRLWTSTRRALRSALDPARP